jgi:phage shock protein C
MSQKWKKIYLDKENAWISGVCAGLARHFEWDVKLVRLGFFLGCWVSAPIFILTYIGMAFFLDPLPTEDLEGDLKVMEEAAKPARPGSARRKFATASDRYQKLETRLRALESVVTSRAFQMDQELGRR